MIELGVVMNASIKKANVVLSNGSAAETDLATSSAIETTVANITAIAYEEYME